MEQELYELLRQCTVRISISGKVGHGTGCFIAPGLILTCSHVVKVDQSNAPSIEVYWNGQLHLAHISIFLPDVDLALLQVNLNEHPCVYLQEEVLPLDMLYSYGYPDDHPSGDPATFSLEGRAGEQGEQLKFKAGQVRPGMSGAPLLNMRTGHVCGIVQLTRDRNNALGGRAIPTTTVFRVFPEVVTRQQQFHLQDRRWTNCLWEVVARTKYLEDIFKRYSLVTLSISLAEDISLQAIFQSLKLRRDPLATEDLIRKERRPLLGELTRIDNNQRRTLQVAKIPEVIANNGDEALHKSPQRRMIILGGPGTGKTTVLKYLIGNQAQKAKVDPTASLPIFVALPDLARSGKTLKEHLLSLVQDIMVDDRYAEALWKAIEDGHAFICFRQLG